MGRIGRHLKAEIDKYIEQVVETRFGYNQSAMTYAPSGDDSPPLENDRIVLVQIDGTGRFVAVGTLSVSQGANPGEKILYSRDSDGEVQAVISLLNDGKIKLQSPDEVSLEAEKAIGIKTKDALNLETEKAIGVKSKDAMNLEASQAMELKGNTMELNSTQTKLTGGMVQCDGTAAPTGSGCFCALPACLFTGAPHTGNMASGC